MASANNGIGIRSEAKRPCSSGGRMRRSCGP